MRYTWRAMKRRCSNPSDKKYHLYGGRGITVCTRWMESFKAFRDDMGPKPSPVHTLDRYPDKNGDYEPGNCRWATPKEQAANMRSNVWLTAFGRTQIMAEWCREFGVLQCVLYQRLKKGITVEVALQMKGHGPRKKRPTS